jgi:hypothetical protein
MALSDIIFTPAEMREMKEAAEESWRGKPHEKAVLPPKGTQLAALKLMMEHGTPEAVAVIAGITVEELQRLVG